MATIQYPTVKGIKYFGDNTVYLRADSGTADQYCTDNSYSYDSFEPENQRFSNDGGLAYMYYGENPGITGVTAWYMEFAFDKIIKTLTTT